MSSDHENEGRSTKNEMRMEGMPTISIPEIWVKGKFSDSGYTVQKKLGSGLRLRLDEKNDKDAHLVFQWLRNTASIEKNTPLSLLTQHGSIRLYNYCSFLQTLTGMVIDDEVIIGDELLALMLGRLPKAVIDLFGWVAPLENVKVIEPNCVMLSLRATAGGVSVVTLIEADQQVWSALLSQSQLYSLEEKDEQVRPYLPLRSSCVVGSCQLTPKMYQSLNVGDVILLETTCFDTLGNGEIEIGDRLFQVSVADATGEDRIIFDIVNREANLEQTAVDTPPTQEADIGQEQERSSDSNEMGGPYE